MWRIENEGSTQMVPLPMSWTTQSLEFQHSTENRWHGAPGNESRTTCDFRIHTRHKAKGDRHPRRRTTGGVRDPSSPSVIGQLKSWRFESSTRATSPVRNHRGSTQTGYCWRSLALDATPTCCFFKRKIWRRRCREDYADGS